MMRQPRSRRLSLLSAMVGLAVLMAACAGGPSGEPAPATAPPADQSGETMPDEPISDPTEPTDEPGSSQPSATSSTTAPPASGSPDESVPAPGDEIPPGSLADRARQMLAEHLGVDPSEIALVSWEEVTWPDGSIGCPQPGMVYTQALVNGSRIVLEHDGVQYHYHQGGPRDLFLCEHPSTGTKSAPGADLDL